MKQTVKKFLKYIENICNYFILRRQNVIYKTNLNKIKGILKIYNSGTFKISKDVRLNSNYNANPIGGQTFSSFFIKQGAVLAIGKNSAISNSTIVCWNNIIIKENVYIGGSCKIYDTDFHSIDYSKRIAIEDTDVKTARIVIQNNVFIGAFSIILKGVEIGENSVIGAGSVVSKSIPPNEVWAGNPIKKIKKL